MVHKTSGIVNFAQAGVALAHDVPALPFVGNARLPHRALMHAGENGVGQIKNVGQPLLGSLRGRIFISKAVSLLCAAKKSRGADHLQNFVYDEMRRIDPDTLADELRQAPEYVPIPEYAFDCHTRRGKAMGKTKADFFRAEHAALVPLEQGLFDHLVDA